MILPDSRCEIHGETLALYQSTSRGVTLWKSYCRSCKRERERELYRLRAGTVRPHHSWLLPRCRNGHPRTPYNFRIYGGTKRCVPCARGKTA